MSTQHELLTSEDRETFKNTMVKARENSRFEESINGFKQIIEWDEAKENIKGEFDVLGHLRIAYTNWAGESDDLEIKKVRLQQANDVQQRILQIAEENFPSDKNRQALANAHYVDLLIDQAILERDMGGNIATQIEQGNKSLDFAFEHLGGSKAHKAWLWNKRAQLAVLSGDIEKAYEAIESGQRALREGYNEETENPDRILKIRVWQSALLLTQSRIYILQDIPELAKLYLTAIIVLEDPTGTLTTRKKQARKMLEELG